MAYLRKDHFNIGGKFEFRSSLSYNNFTYQQNLNLLCNVQLSKRAKSSDILRRPQNFEKNLPLKIWRYSVTSNFKWRNFSNFVAFSEYPNFIRNDRTTTKRSMATAFYQSHLPWILIGFRFITIYDFRVDFFLLGVNNFCNRVFMI